MITRWSLNNFKSVGGRIDLPMSPLTIFVGANSSGKSTIIQSILITAQTLQSAINNKAIVLNGPIVRLGVYEDIVHRGKINSNVSIGFTLNPSSLAKDSMHFHDEDVSPFPSPSNRTVVGVGVDFSFGIQASDDNSLMINPEIVDVKMESHVQLVDGRGPVKETISVSRTQKTLSDKLTPFNLTDALSPAQEIALRYDIADTRKIAKRYHRYRGASIIGAELNHFLPSRALITYDVGKQQVYAFIDSLIGRPYPISQWSGIPKEVSSSLNRIVDEFLKEKAKIIGAKDERLIMRIIDVISREGNAYEIRNLIDSLSPRLRSSLEGRLTESVDFLIGLTSRPNEKQEYKISYSPLGLLMKSGKDYAIEQFTSKLRYLGPLRDEPKPIYQISNSADSRDIGYKGEFTASVLELHRNTKIRYICSANYASEQITSSEGIEASLVDAVADWLSYLGVANEVSTSDRGKLGVEIKIGMTDTSLQHDPTHVGVGVSQVLPILVMSLLAPTDSTLIFEQPELHLHPRVQTRLADFFVGLMGVGKQCIVESHSEYMINRLRYWSAISDDDSVSNNTAIFFVEKEGSNSSYRSVRINKYGVIEDWPKGFFDESEGIAAKILKAGVNKARAERK